MCFAPLPFFFELLLRRHELRRSLRRGGRAWRRDCWRPPSWWRASLATNRSISGWTVRSFSATMYQLGFDFQAVSSNFRVEQVGSRHALGRPNEFLLLLGQIFRKTVAAFGTQPDTSVGHLDVGEDVGLRELRLLGLRCHVSLRS